jgi:oligoribonuclease NrnB/cAMP/cGMP phosphodiesterase (DHH superfamily)
MLQLLVLYHDDLDGVFSALAFKQSPTFYMAGFGARDCEILFRAVNYGQPFPEDLLYQMDENTKVYILDFSYPREVLKVIEKLTGKHPFIYEHHLGTKKELEGLPNVFFNENECGATLVFKANSPNASRVPFLLDTVKDLDRREKRLPDSSLFECGLKNLLLGVPLETAYENFTSRGLSFLWETPPEALEKFREYSKPLYEEKLKEIEDFARNKEKRSLAGKLANHPIRFFNHRKGYYNDFHEVLYTSTDLGPIDFTLSFFLREEDAKWCFDLRSAKTSELNLGELAKKFGGGGHPNAAGFTMEYEEGLDFLSMIRR